MKTHIALRSVFLSALLSATATSAPAATNYAITPLQGIEAGSPDNWPVAIGPTGAIAGMSWAFDSYKAAYWDNTGAVTEIFPGSPFESYAFDLNSAEQVILPGPHIWDNGVVTPLVVDIGLWKFSGNLSINDAGQVAGNIYLDVGGSLKPHAALLTNGETNDLGVLAGMTSSAVNSLNNLGDVAGYSFTTFSQSRAVLWSEGNIVDLGVLPGQSVSSANDVNDNRRVVGTSGGRLFTWENGVMTDLGTIEAGATMIANAINDNGEIVGLYLRSGSSATRAFHWSNGTFTDLSALFIAGNNCDAADINDAGQIAVQCQGGWRLDPTAPATDLGVAVYAPSISVSQGAPFTYTIDVTNVGALPATNVRLNDVLPASVTFVSVTTSQGTCSGTTTVVCNLGDLASNTKVTLQLTVIPNVVGGLSHTASVSGNETETNTLNNTSGAGVYVAAAATDLGVKMIATPNPVKRNANLTYAINVKNSGPVGATGVVVTDTLPSSMSFVSASSSQGSCSGTTTVTCTLGSMANGASANVTIVVKPRSTGTYTNKVSVSSSTTDSNTVNNNASVSVRVK